MVAHQRDDRRASPPRVVQIGDAVAQAWTVVEEHKRGSPGHARVAVRSARADAFEHPQHGAHSRRGINGRQEGDLRRPWIGEADLQARRRGGRHDGFRAVHWRSRLAHFFINPALRIWNVWGVIAFPLVSIYMKTLPSGPV